MESYEDQHQVNGVEESIKKAVEQAGFEDVDLDEIRDIVKEWRKKCVDGGASKRICTDHFKVVDNKEAINIKTINTPLRQRAMAAQETYQLGRD